MVISDSLGVSLGSPFQQLKPVLVSQRVNLPVWRTLSMVQMISGTLVLSAVLIGMIGCLTIFGGCLRIFRVVSQFSGCCLRILRVVSQEMRQPMSWGTTERIFCCPWDTTGG